MKFRIKYNDGGYFQGMTGLGPMFGGTKKEAVIFHDKRDAGIMLSSHFGFTMADIEEEKVK